MSEYILIIWVLRYGTWIAENKSSFGMASQWREEVEKKTFTFFSTSLSLSLSRRVMFNLLHGIKFNVRWNRRLSSSLALKWLQTLIWIAHSFSVYVVVSLFFFCFLFKRQHWFSFHLYNRTTVHDVFKEKDTDGKISAYCEQKKSTGRESIALGWKEEKKAHIQMIRTSDGCWSFHHAIHHIDSLYIALVLQIEMRKINYNFKVPDAQLKSA